MSLTKDDLLAIKQIVNEAIDERVPKIIDEQVPGIVTGVVQPMLDTLRDDMIARIDRLDDSLSMQLENGLEEVRKDVAGVKDMVNRVDMQQHTMAEQLDDHAVRLNRIERKLKLRVA